MRYNRLGRANIETKKGKRFTLTHLKTEKPDLKSFRNTSGRKAALS
jgi:hypothetical protein